MKIYKYPLQNTIGLPQHVGMPRTAKILDFRIQHLPSYNTYYDAPIPSPVIWAVVDEKAPSEKRTFVLRFTGDDVNLRVRNRFDSGIIYGKEIYIGTDIENSGLVYHLFEIVE